MAIKLRLEEGLSVEAMDIQREDRGKRRRFLKMSVGENPKGGAYPNTRLSEAAILREYFSKAKIFRDEQDFWCTKMEGNYPEDTVLQPLVDVLRGDMQVHVHGYKTEDLEVGPA